MKLFLRLGSGLFFLFFYIIFVTASPASGAALEEKPVPAPVDPAVIPPDFTATDLNGQVAEAMDRAVKNYDISAINYLMDAYRNDPDQVLDLLYPYTKRPEDMIKIAIVQAASSAQTKKAMMLFTTVLSDTRVDNHTARALYFAFNRQQIKEWGSDKLKTALYRSVISDRDATHSVVLLSVFEPDPKIAAFLKRRQQSYLTDKKAQVAQAKEPQPKTKPKKAISENAPRDTSRERVCIDLALSEWGDNDALERVKQYFAQNKVRELVVLLDYIDFTENKTILLSAVELLKNKSNAVSTTVAYGPPSVGESKPRKYPFTRLCDEALAALYRRTHLGQFFRPRPRFSDKQLDIATKKLKAIFEKDDEPEDKQ